MILPKPVAKRTAYAATQQIGNTPGKTKEIKTKQNNVHFIKILQRPNERLHLGFKAPFSQFCCLSLLNAASHSHSISTDVSVVRLLGHQALYKSSFISAPPASHQTKQWRFQQKGT
jgi:hypothetical protein